MTRVLPAIARAALFVVLWVVLTDGAGRNPAVALATIAAATAASLWLWPPRPRRIRWSRVPVLLAYFAWHALRGGIDVAARALSPVLPIHAAVIRYESRLAGDTARVLLAWMVGLMPGTACVGLDGTTLSVHVIDRRTYGPADLRHLERRIRDVFGPDDGRPGSRGPTAGA
jgi:multicomponent Na+:H+ antiporter subunit E